jgi:hypothetical protein
MHTPQADLRFPEQIMEALAQARDVTPVVFERRHCCCLGQPSSSRPGGILVRFAQVQDRVSESHIDSFEVNPFGLFQADIDPSLPTLFITECVLVYLKAGANGCACFSHVNERVTRIGYTWLHVGMLGGPARSLM